MNDWCKSPPDYTPFNPCWVTNGQQVFLAAYREGEWKIGAGLAFDPAEITHYQILLAPSAPTKIQKQLVSSDEVNYADF